MWLLVVLQVEVRKQTLILVLHAKVLRSVALAWPVLSKNSYFLVKSSQNVVIGDRNLVSRELVYYKRVFDKLFDQLTCFLIELLVSVDVKVSKYEVSESTHAVILLELAPRLQDDLLLDTTDSNDIRLS